MDTQSVEELLDENRRLKEQLRQTEKLISQVVWAFAWTVEAKDSYTSGHSQRVAEYAWKLAKKLGKDAEEQKKVYCVGLLHDIGKVGVPDGTINSTSRLTDEQFKQIKKHPKIGGSILDTIEGIPDIAVGARWHHERYDGTGYPDGLKGTEIPEIARIIAVADAYDAMTSTRSYRGIMSQAEARSEIEKGAGTQFDPVVAGKMLELIDEDIEFEMHE